MIYLVLHRPWTFILKLATREQEVKLDFFFHFLERDCSGETHELLSFRASCNTNYLALQWFTVPLRGSWELLLPFGHLEFSTLFLKPSERNRFSWFPFLASSRQKTWFCLRPSLENLISDKLQTKKGIQNVSSLPKTLKSWPQVCFHLIGMGEH